MFAVDFFNVVRVNTLLASILFFHFLFKLMFHIL